MTGPRRICVVTGGRADYGLLQWVMHDIAADPELTLQVIATGSHLEPGMGMTVAQIEADGLVVDARVPLGLGDDDRPEAVARAMAAALTGVAEAIGRLAPDLLLVLGDRYEILAAAEAALLHRLPIAHIAGGDVTEGAFDDAIRNALTQMAHVHLVTHAGAARRVAAMGEAAWRIHTVGSPGLDQLHRAPRLERAALEEALGAPLGRRNLLVTFHPVTLAPDGGLGAAHALLEALSTLPPDVVLWCSLPNADPGAAAIAGALHDWAVGRDNVRIHASLGQQRYLSLMALADAVVGNSSSGLYEAPSLGVPTVDVGDRQAGRVAAASVIRCPARPAEIAAALATALATGRSDGANPYGDGRSAERIVAVLKALPSREVLLAKHLQERAA